MLDGDLDDRSKILIATFAADIAGIDAILRQCARAVRVFGEEQVPVVMEIAHDRHDNASVRDSLADFRDGRRGLVVVDSHAHQL